MDSRARRKPEKDAYQLLERIEVVTSEIHFRTVGPERHLHDLAAEATSLAAASELLLARVRHAGDRAVTRRLEQNLERLREILSRLELRPEPGLAMLPY